MKQLVLDTPDLNSVPSDQNIRSGVDFIMSMRNKSFPNNVYVHCKAGRSRSATIVACYLIRVNFFFSLFEVFLINYLLESRSKS